MKNISTVVSDRYNILLNFNGYKNTGYIAYVIINEYFKQIHLNNDILENIVYIDTNLLVEDYKRLMKKLTRKILKKFPSNLRNCFYVYLFFEESYEQISCFLCFFNIIFWILSGFRSKSANYCHSRYNYL